MADAALNVLGIGVNILSEKNSFDHANQTFRVETDLSKRMHLMESFMEMQTQFILLDSDLVANSRVRERML
jgi:hypothetical protein